LRKRGSRGKAASVGAESEDREDAAVTNTAGRGGSLRGRAFFPNAKRSGGGRGGEWNLQVSEIGGRRIKWKGVIPG